MATTTIPLTPERFESGLTWRSYLSEMKDHRETSSSLYENSRLSAENTERFSRFVERHGGRLSISAITEDWCGDSAVTLPIVARLAEAVPGVEFRVLVQNRYPEIRAAYREDGYESIPVLSLFDAEWTELGRWMERPKSANARVAAWVAERPRIKELYGKEDHASKRELKEIFGGLVLEMAEWYPQGYWDDLLDELAAILE